MTEIFKALSEESRLRILSILLDKNMCVCELEASLSMTQSNVSRHLSVLKKCGILDSDKNAQWIYYYISPNFKEEQRLLWEYLSENLRKLPTYEEDLAACNRSRACDLCHQQKGESDYE